MSKNVCKYGIYKCIISVKNWVRLKVLSTKLKAENVYHTVSTIMHCLVQFLVHMQLHTSILKALTFPTAMSAVVDNSIYIFQNGIQ